MRRLLLATLALGCAAGVAPAAEQTPADNDLARVCDAYGEGYHLIPGTTTCLKIGGYVKMQVTGGSGTGSGQSGIANGDFLGPPNPPKTSTNK
jgi:hypothetical protein